MNEAELYYHRFYPGASPDHQVLLPVLLVLLWYFCKCCYCKDIVENIVDTTPGRAGLVWLAFSQTQAKKHIRYCETCDTPGWYYEPTFFKCAWRSGVSPTYYTFDDHINQNGEFWVLRVCHTASCYTHNNRRGKKHAPNHCLANQSLDDVLTVRSTRATVNLCMLLTSSLKAVGIPNEASAATTARMFFGLRARLKRLPPPPPAFVAAAPPPASPVSTLLSFTTFTMSGGGWNGQRTDDFGEMRRGESDRRRVPATFYGVGGKRAIRLDPIRPPGGPCT